MRITILTLFNELFDMYLSQNILNRAKQKDIVKYDIVNIRDYADNKHRQVDDTPYGGGNGMVLKPEPFFNYFKNIKKEGRKPYIIFMTPQGKKLNQAKITELLNKDDIVLISGRYEGLDQRVIDTFVDEEISVGDYVLTSGDLPALIITDALIRQKEGVIKENSYKTDSFYNGLLGFPQYTKPSKIGRLEVPEVLQSGNHKKIEEYRLEQSIKKTLLNRPDLFLEKTKDDKFNNQLNKILKKMEEK